jgi:hypothetical protein
MCPYFWTYVLIFLFLPFILLLKLFGSAGTRALKFSKDYKYNKEKNAIADLQFQINRKDLTDIEIYKIINSKCYNKYKYDVMWDSYEHKNSVFDKYYAHQNKLRSKDSEAYAKQQERKRKLEKQFSDVNKKMTEIKDYKIFTYISYVVVGAMGLFLLYGFYSLISLIPFSSIDWGGVFYGLLIIVVASVVFGGGYLLIRYAIIPFGKWLSCRRLPSCSMCEGMKNFFAWCASWLKYGIYIVMPFWWLILGIGKVCVIIGHMIYSTYKKQCPIIEWKDE